MLINLYVVLSNQFYRESTVLTSLSQMSYRVILYDSLVYCPTGLFV
jgi:hypothetical protein